MNLGEKMLSKKQKRILKLRIRYYKKKIFRFLGYCPDCHNRVNFTRLGRAICPLCGK